ncbi:MAG: tetratricopeptide repeat protein [Deltaproteobacteria bacterium]|nr:tetratricopeptide repeat protein [Deltaproteobacteria bacterium]
MNLADLMLPGKQIASHLGIAKTVALLLVVVFAWQVSVSEALSEVISSPPARDNMRKEHGVAKQAVPSLRELASINVHQGLKYYDLGRWQEAIVAFTDALAINPDFAVAHFGLGVTYSRLDNWETALTYFEKTIELNPTFAQGYLGLGIAYDILGFNDKAMKALKRAVLIDPRFAQAHHALALCYLRNGDRASALAEYEILRGLNPDLADQLIQLIKK